MRDHARIHEIVLDSMDDGVIALDAEGQIRTFNQAAAQILGMSRDATLGRSFAELFVAREGFDEFTQAILDTVLDPDSTGQRDAGIDLSDGPRVLTVATTLLRGEGGEAGRQRGVVAVFRDVTAIVRLRESEAALAEKVAAQYRELEHAYRAIEARQERRDESRRGARTAWRLGAAALVVVAAALGYWVWDPGGPGGGEAARQGEAAKPQAAQTVVAEPRRLLTTLLVPGRLAAGRTHRVVSTVEGTVSELGFRYGERVTEGQLVVRLNVEKVRQDRRALVVERIESSARLAELEGWEDGPEMNTARRAMDNARRDLRKALARVEDARFLLDEGVISANEHDEAVAAHRDAGANLEDARRTLEATRAKGGAEALRAARLKHRNIEERLAALDRALAGAEVRAPGSGIAVLPDGGQAEGGEGEDGPLDVGKSVGQGSLLLEIVDSETFAIGGNVSEDEVVKLKAGQAVTVTGDAFPGVELAGRLVHVSSQAAEGGGYSSGRAAQFAVLAQLDPVAEEVRRGLRLGMTADMVIVTRDRPDAILLPLDAVERAGGEYRVRRRDRTSGAVETVPVEVGRTTLGEIEIAAGLEAGDEIVIGHAPAESGR